MDQETQRNWEYRGGVSASWVDLVAFRGDMEDLESHVGPGLGKNVLDEGAVCVEGAEHVGEGLAQEAAVQWGWTLPGGNQGCSGEKVERLAGLGHPDKELDYNQEGLSVG